MAIIERGAFKSNISSFLPDNNQRLISEKDVRDRFYEVEESYISKISGFDIPEYSPLTVYSIGDAVVSGGVIYRKINAASSGILPPNASHWSAYSTTPFATEIKRGIVKKAQVSDLTSPTDNDKYITPYLLNEFLNIVGGVNSLDDLNDVTLGTLSNGQALVYDSGINQWTNQNVVSDNIYISDGSLTGNRVIDGNGNSLSFNNLSMMAISGKTIDVTIESGGSGFLISDDRAVKNGAEYSSDYSATYSDRSLSDWGAVKARISAIAGIGTNDLNLGIFAGTTIPDNQTVKQAIQSLESAIEGITFNNGNGTTWNAGANAYDLGGALNQATSISTGANSLQWNINNDSGSILFNDSRTTTLGIQYGADYSLGFTARSLVDRGFVETEESQLVGNVLGQDFLTFTGIDYIPNGNYTVKAAIEALSNGLGNFTPGSVIFAGPTGELAQDNANLFWDNSSNVFRTNSLSIGVVQGSNKIYSRLNETSGTPLLFNDNAGGKYFEIVKTSAFSGYATIGTGDTSTPHQFWFTGANSISPVNQNNYTSIQSLNRVNTNNLGAGFIAQHGYSANEQRLRIMHHTDYSGVNSYLNRTAHFALDKSAYGGNYVQNKFIFSAFNFSSVPDPSLDTWEYHTYVNGDNTINSTVTKRFALDGNGTLALFNAYTTAPYSATVPTSVEPNSFKLYSKNYNDTDTKASPYFRTEDNKVLSVQRAHHRDFLLEFFPSLETVRYISYDWSTAAGGAIIKEFRYDTNQIDSISVRFRRSSTGSAGAYSAPFVISSPLNTTQIDALNSAIGAGSDSVELQITVTFDVAWTTQAQVQIITEPNLNR